MKVKREKIAACMTCPICSKLLRDATTISECLHTFCRKCIYKKILDEEVESCPICNIDLGCTPLEKLRPDHNMQDVRAKIFPFKRRKVDPPEPIPSVSLPVRRKERSLSSLVVNMPRVSTKASMTGRRTKAVAKKTNILRGCGFITDKPIKKEFEDHRESSSSRDSLQNFPATKLSSGCVPNEETPTNGVHQWKPLNYLVEVANNTKSHKLISKGSINKSLYNEGFVRKTKIKDENHGIEASFLSEPLQPKKPRKIRKKKETIYEDSGISPQAVLDSAGSKREKRTGPVWFSLVPSRESSLPQISSSYLRIKDGNLLVSSIQKYLMRKLNLTSEAEVEIKCMGEPVIPTLELHNLVDLWLHTISTSQRVKSSIGASAKDFVMILDYARKASLES